MIENQKKIVEVYSYINNLHEEDEDFFTNIKLKSTSCDEKLWKVGHPYHSYIFEYNSSTITPNVIPDKSWLEDSDIKQKFVNLIFNHEISLQEYENIYEQKLKNKITLPILFFILQKAHLTNINLTIKSKVKFAKKFIQDNNSNEKLDEKKLHASEENLQLDILFIESIIKDIEFPEEYFKNLNDLEFYNHIKENERLKDFSDLLHERLNTLNEIYSSKIEEMTEKFYFKWEQIAEWTIVAIILFETVVGFIEFLYNHNK